MRFAARLVLLLAAVVSINCARFFPTPIGRIRKPLVEKRLYIDDTFDASDVRCIESSADEWNRRTKGLASITVVPLTSEKSVVPKDTTVDDIVMTRVTSDSAIVFFIERLTGSLLYGYYQPQGDHSEITMVHDRYKSEFVCRMVLMHELGHALGIHHNTDPASLMYGGDDVMPTGITHRDLTDFCRIYGCRPDDLSPP